MLYTTFVKLLNQAESYPDSQEFIMSLGWQPWMDKRTKAEANESFVDADEVVKDLTTIYELAALDFKGLRRRTKLSMAKMGVAYQIPLRTIESWDSGGREIASYTLNLLKYSVFIGEREGDDNIDFAE